jgi:hypothetical protein
MSFVSSRAKPYLIAGGSFVGVIIVSIITSLITVRMHTSEPAKPPAENYRLLNIELADCIDHTIKMTEGTKLELTKYTDVWRLCENQMFDQLLLNDFTIRRQKFEANTLDERVNLWLVVAITLSGVFLSAMQLAMSYRLAQIAKTDLAGNNELVVEQGKLSLKSSVTGLLIMALSLIFFVIYVKWIYQNFDVVTQKPDNLNAFPFGKLVPGGGSLGMGNSPPARPTSAKPSTPSFVPRQADPALSTDEKP